MSGRTVRAAGPLDAATIHRFITELAIYENEPDAVDATVESLRAQLESEAPPFECLIAEVDDRPVGFALFFSSYSTWTGRPGIYLEDLFVSADERGHGHGLALLAALAALTVERGGTRLDWQVLDWNTPSIDFYEAIGAEIRRTWLPCRLSAQALIDLAAQHRR